MGAARRQHLPPAPSRFFVLFVSELPHAKALCPHVAPMQPIIPSMAGMTVASVWPS